MSLKSHTSERGKESAISLIFLLLHFNVQSLGLLWFWLTTVSETPPGFLKMNFNFSFKDSHTIIGTSNGYPLNLPILSAEFNVYCLQNLEGLFSHKVQFTSGYEHHLFVPNVNWVPATGPALGEENNPWPQEAHCCNCGAWKRPVSISQNSKPSFSLWIQLKAVCRILLHILSIHLVH